jgi:aryl-alcohol dehydrogenase-like predicted oxidoreductase
MQYTTLGSSGLKISRIALGCMSFGDTSRGFNQWALHRRPARLDQVRLHAEPVQPHATRG